MEKKFKFKSVTEFERFVSKNDYWKVIPIKIVESIIKFQDYAVIKEIENPETLVTHLKIEPCKAISEIFYKMEVIKEDLNKYAKEGIENPENCTIEKVRQELLKIRNHFGENWREEHFFTMDKYAELKKLIKYVIKLNVTIFPGKEINNLLLIVDRYKGDSLWIGKKFGNKLYILLERENLINEDIGNLLSFIIYTLSTRFKKINIDFSVLNKTKYEALDITSNGEYIFTNLNCHFVKCTNGVVTIKNSIIDKLDLTSKQLRSITLENIMVSKLPVFNIPKKDVVMRNVKTFGQIDKEKKEKIRNILKNQHKNHHNRYNIITSTTTI